MMPAAHTCYHFNSAIVRSPSRSIANGLRAEDHGDPAYEIVQEAHAAYVKALESCGVAVTVLPALEAFPDSIFVEDPALVFSEGAVLLRSGAPSREGESKALAPVLRELFDTVLELPQPGHVDGGDILVTPRSVMIGLSARTDLAGAKALLACLQRLGYDGRMVNTPDGVLHFKTDCSLLDEETVLVTGRMAQSAMFDGFRKIVLPEGDEPAANAVRVNSSVLVSAQYERAVELLDREGYSVLPVDTTEIEKIDAGLSCMSLRWFAAR